MMNSLKKRTIDRSSSVPLYKQIKEILIEELRESGGEAGRPFSTEQELVSRFHVSRAPVRQALKELADEGFVYRERAKGTFPVQELPVRPLGLELGGLMGFLREQGLDCHSEILGTERMKAPENVREAILLPRDEEVLKIARLIYLKEKPLIMTETFLCVPEDFQPTVEVLEEVESIFELLKSERGIVVSRGDHQIYASAATKEEAQRLGVKNKAPILVMETKLYTRENLLVGWRRAVHKADDYKLSFTVNR